MTIIKLESINGEDEEEEKEEAEEEK